MIPLHESPPIPDREHLSRWIATTCGVSEPRARLVLDTIVDVVAPTETRTEYLDRIHRLALTTAGIAKSLRSLEARLDDLIDAVSRQELQS